MTHQKKSFRTENKTKFLNCNIYFKSLLMERHQILSKYQNVMTNKTNIFELKKTTFLNCKICFKSLSENPTSETKFNLSDNFSDFYFWSEGTCFNLHVCMAEGMGKCLIKNDYISTVLSSVTHA